MTQIQRYVLALACISAAGAGIPAFGATGGTAAAVPDAQPKTGWLGNLGIQFRPYAALQWFSVSGAKGLARPARAGWMGARVQTEFAFFRWPIAEVGANAYFYRSFLALTPDAESGQATEGGAQGYLLFKANTTVFGVPMLRVMGGYYANIRTA